MRPLRTRLEEARNRLGIPWEVLERDYLLSWVLAGIRQVESLRETLVFKGGTALKKCYFGEYRFSEDLDFSAFPGVPRRTQVFEEWPVLVSVKLRAARLIAVDCVSHRLIDACQRQQAREGLFVTESALEE